MAANLFPCFSHVFRPSDVVEDKNGTLAFVGERFQEIIECRCLFMISVEKDIVQWRITLNHHPEYVVKGAYKRPGVFQAEAFEMVGSNQCGVFAPFNGSDS
jgi:hypothetical protein